MSEAVPILSVRDARRHYGADKPALKKASLDLYPGRITALLGPSGSGKSTLLRSIAGLEALDEGTISCGETIWNDGTSHLPPEQRRVGMVFQDYALFPHLNALNNVAFGLTGPDKKKHAMAQLAAAELGHKANAYPHELSGGEQQRVALARALAPSPAIMLLDEPFSGLDRRLRKDLRERTISSLRASGTAALIVTHDAEEAMAIADELALMDAGCDIQCGTPGDVWLNPVSALAARLLGDVDTVSGRVAEGLVETPLGTVTAKGFTDGETVEVLVRPNAIAVTPDDNGTLTITNRHSVGAEISLTLKDQNNDQWHAFVSAPSALNIGDNVSVVLNETFVSVVKG